MSQSQSRRRDFLRVLGLSSIGVAAHAPYSAFASHILRNLFVSSTAKASTGITNRNYININLNGGPLRVQYDLWLRTNADDPAILSHPMAGNSFLYNATTGLVTGSEYRTYDYNGTLVPHLFSTLSSADQDSLLSQFLVIRGYGSGADGHPLNNQLQTLPLAGEPSLSGMIIDKSDKYFKGVQYPNRGGGYSSAKSISINGLGYTSSGQNPLNNLFQTIAVGASHPTRDVRDRYSSLFSSVRRQLDVAAPGSKAAQIARKGMDDAYDLFNQGAPDVATWWAVNLPLYQATIESYIRDANIPGITSNHEKDLPLRLVSNGSTLYRMRTGAGSDFTFTNGTDLVQCILANGTIQELAEGLAMAEFCISNGYSSVAEIGMGVLDGILPTPTSAVSAKMGHNLDMHGTGAYASTLLNSLYFRGLLGGLLRLKTQLQAAGKWNTTIVQVVGDFSRTFRAGGEGSDHGFNQMVTSIFTGVVQGGPYVVGNISTVGQNGLAATQGYAAPIQGYSVSGRPKVTTMASTVYALTDVNKNPWINQAAPLVTLNTNGTILYPYGKGKLVLP